MPKKKKRFQSKIHALHIFVIKTRLFGFSAKILHLLPSPIKTCKHFFWVRLRCAKVPSQMRTKGLPQWRKRKRKEAAQERRKEEPPSSFRGLPLSFLLFNHQFIFGPTPPSLSQNPTQILLGTGGGGGGGGGKQGGGEGGGVPNSCERVCVCVDSPSPFSPREGFSRIRLPAVLEGEREEVICKKKIGRNAIYFVLYLTQKKMHAASEERFL